MKITGIPIYPGVVLGNAFVFSDAFDLTISLEADSLVSFAEKREAFRSAVAKAHKQLVAAMDSIEDKSSDAYTILDAQSSILYDEAINEEILCSLESGSCLSTAINSSFDSYIEVFRNAENDFTRERAADMDDIRKRILRCLSGTRVRSLGDMTVPSVIVAEDLSPSDTATLNKDMVLAIVTEKGGETSHTAILARSLGIPTILGAGEITDLVKEGDPLGINAESGEIFIRPTTEEISALQKLRTSFEVERQKLAAHKNAVAKTLDGARIHIEVNISAADSISDEDAAVSDGVGLMRSEFLYMHAKSLPDEDAQYKAYRDVLDKFKGKPVILRTLDIGGDKNLPSLSLPKEDNPFLGCRAVRLCFEKAEIFKTQLRAALRASAHGPLQIMFPMISSLDDWRRAKEFVEHTKEELLSEEKSFRHSIPLGIMIEIPSAALLSNRLAKEVDFASVGTNDLCQYLHAADRLNPRVSQYYQSYSPAMLRILRYIAHHYTESSTPVGICGEMGGNPCAAPLLIGLGFRKLSMNASSLGGVKQVVRHISLGDAKCLAQRACDAASQAEVLQLLEEFRQSE